MKKRILFLLVFNKSFVPLYSDLCLNTILSDLDVFLIGKG